MKTDTELLRHYLDEKSEAAFAELVRLHVGLVYSVALRRVGGDAHLAEDVAQTVFTDLARKAASLRTRPTLGGWLYVSAHAASAAVVRREQRRKARELAAHTMDLPTSEPAPDWTRLRPVIDDAIVDLKQDDREAVVLRFFEQRSFAEIGAALQLTDEAARKRVDRALDKLRSSLARRGITSTVGALGLALGAIASTSVPAGLSAKLAGSAYATAFAPAGGASVGAWLAVALPSAALLVIGGLGLAQRHANHALRHELGQLAVDRTTLAALQTQNRDLARRIAETDQLRTAAHAAMPEAPRAPTDASGPRAIAAKVALTPQGTIAWNNDWVSLREFIEQLRHLKATAAPGSRLHVDTNDASYSAVTYIIEEARKAGIEHLTVQGGGKAAGEFSWWWF